MSIFGLLKLFYKALCGRFLWKKMSKNHSRDLFILIPSDSDNIFYYSSLFLNDVLIEKNYDKAVFLCEDVEKINQLSHQYSTNMKASIKLSRKQINNLITSFRLYSFGDNFILASFDEPFGRNARKALKKFPESTKDLFALGIYHLKPFTFNYEKNLIG